MASRAKQHKSELIDAVVVEIHRRLPKAQARKLDGFVRRYYGDVSPEDLAEFNAETLYGEALSVWRFAQKRKPGEPRIRVYNPRHEEHGWQSTHTVVEIINDDMPFLVDSVASALNRPDLLAPKNNADGGVGGVLTVHLLIHPILRVRRDGGGKLVEVLGDDDGDSDDVIAESILHVEISQQSSQAVLDGIRDGLGRVLEDNRAAVEDWRPTLARIDEIIAVLDRPPPGIAKDEVTETKAFLAWIRDNHFTFLGYRGYRLMHKGERDYLRIEDGSSLGVLRKVLPGSVKRAKTPMTRAASRFARRKQLLIITKANTRATVHRPVYMDYVGVRRFDKRGKVTGEHRFLGLFTSAAYNHNPCDIPMLRNKVARIIERSPFGAGSHNGKALLNILETYPRDELFQTDADELYDISHGILHLEERQRIRLFMRRDDYARFFSCLVYVPRERYNTDLRMRMQAVLLKSLGGASAEFTAQVSEAVMARLHYIVHTPGGKGETGEDAGARRETDTEAIEKRLVETMRVWTDDLKDACVERWGEADGMARYHRYQDAFPAAYTADSGAQTAVADIHKIETLDGAGSLAMNLYARLDADEGTLHFKVYHSTDPVPLSDILPMLENMGLKVIEETPYRIEPHGPEDAGSRDDGSPGDHGEGGFWIHDFGMKSEGDAEVDVTAVKQRFQDAFTRIWSGEAENDGFNRLVLSAGLTWREVNIMRAYSKFRLQAWKAFSQPYMEETLGKYPALTAMLIELFGARFDPAGKKGRAKAVADLDQRIAVAVDIIASRDEDRIMRRYHRLISATLRTNYYQTDSTGHAKPYLSFKLESRSIGELPLPRPWVEVFVYSPRFEAVHLRGGDVARGGLRWSDRREDFRTEVLGLMKAQMVKNAVIVPVGAKGGFYVKRQFRADQREARLEEGIACYRSFISGLLDITDNLVDGKVAPPPDVVRHDGDDPYLVVAADKGTATFSDFANEVAISYGFWLGDAFASGGSEGYDHKVMGITAKGAWESVKRHFRELGADTQTTDFTCMGIGDMAGDVFGNGMLLSRHIRLIGAFNHLHIFIDPEPHAATGFKERQRLFKKARSSWADYNSKLISKGGGVFERQAKSIKLTPEIKAVLEIDADAVTPIELIGAMLRAPVDLLWNGGIGTYVKARDESHEEVGDRDNDELRVNGMDLRCRVIGEGGNLGLTQRGRIEYALAGGRVYSDAIDNSAGVDCSDHEVNIKILLGDIVANGDMTSKQRSKLLAQMTDEVGALVLLDNYRQTQAISVALAQGGRLLESQARLMRDLERAGDLNRAIEDLPDDDALAERQKAGLGLTGPEFSVLLAYSKMTLYQTLLDSELPEDPYLAIDLVRYFPAPLQKHYETVIHGHRLRREIIVTSVTNSMINRVGAAFVAQAVDNHGFTPSDVARAYAITRDCYGLRALWAAIEALDNKVPAAVQIDLLLDVGRLVERGTLWFLRNRPRPLDIAATVDGFKPGIETLSRHLKVVLSTFRAKALLRAATRYADRGVPKTLARRVASLYVLAAAPDIVHTAQRNSLAVEAAGDVYFQVGEELGIDWLRSAAAGFGAESHWQRQAVTAIVDDLYGQQRALTAAVIEGSGRKSVSGAVAKWVAAHQGAVDRTRRLIDDLRKADSQDLDLAMLTVANRQIRMLSDG